jgi:hypothetical protein
MKAQVRIEVIIVRLAPVARNTVEAAEGSTTKLPELVHLEGWRSDGLLAGGYVIQPEGGRPCNR